MSPVAAGFALGAARLRRRPAWLAAALGLALAVASALVERRVTSVGAVDRALEATLGLVVPLASFAAVTAVTSRERLRESVWPVARYGASARAVALGACAAAALAAAGFGALVAVIVVLVAHGPAAPPLATDAAVSAWLGALAAAAYVGWFSLGAAFGRRGGLRLAPLALDFTVGGTAGVLGAALPRGHVHALLGGAAPLGLPRLACTAILLAMAIALTAAASARAGD